MPNAAALNWNHVWFNFLFSPASVTRSFKDRDEKHGIHWGKARIWCGLFGQHQNWDVWYTFFFLLYQKLQTRITNHSNFKHDQRKLYYFQNLTFLVVQMDTYVIYRSINKKKLTQMTWLFSDFVTYTVRVKTKPNHMRKCDTGKTSSVSKCQNRNTSAYYVM